LKHIDAMQEEKYEFAVLPTVLYTINRGSS